MDRVLLAFLAWLLGIASTIGVQRLKAVFSAVPLCLTKLDECATAGERAVRCQVAGEKHSLEMITALTLRSELGQNVARGFGSHKAISNALLLFSLELGSCDSETDRGTAAKADVEKAIRSLRVAQQGLRLAIRKTRKGRLSEWFTNG